MTDKAKPVVSYTEDKKLLDWVAVYVSQINTIDVKGMGGERVEVIWHPTVDTTEITTRNGKTEVEAFRKCIKAAIRAHCAERGE